MAKKSLPCPTMVRLLLRYEPETGKLFWRSRPGWLFPSPVAAMRLNKRDAGREAGHKAKNGYIHVRIRFMALYAHRIAWAHYYGAWPSGQVDHINGNPSDNRIANLRDVSPSVNARNARQRSDNTSGATGVYFDSRRGKWYARVAHLYLGYCDTQEDAIAARRAAEEKLGGFTDRHGN